MTDINAKAIYPGEAAEYYREWGFSPAIESNGFIFVSGCTGTSDNGDVPDGIEAQSRQAFARIQCILNEAGVSFSDIVEMTTYHVDLNEHLKAFIEVKKGYITEPFPAWTAIGVSELASAGALIEIRVIAKSKITK